MGTSPIVGDVGSSVSVPPAAVLDQQVKDDIFIASYLGTHLLILGGGLWNFYGAGIFFQKFLNKPM